MKGLGVIINVLAVIIAGNLGLIFRGKLKAAYQELLLRACGVVTLIVAVMGLLESLFRPENGRLNEVQGSILIPVSIAIGAVLGYSWNMEGAFSAIARFFKELFTPGQGKKNEKSSRSTSARAGKPGRRLADLPVYNLPSERSGHRFEDGFTISSLFVATSSFVMTGVVAEAGGDHKLLLFKTIMDAVMVFALATVFGTGVSFSAVTLVLCEGGSMLLVATAPEFFGGKMAGQMAVIGAVVVFLLGLSLTFRKNFKPANLLPAFLIPALYYGIDSIVNKIVAGVA